MTLFCFAMAWLAGIALSQALPLRLVVWLAISLATIIIFYVSPPKRTLRLLIGGAIILFFGATRYRSAQPPLDPGQLAWYNDRGEVSLTGVVVDWPEAIDGEIRLRVRVERLRLEGANWVESPAGLVLMRAPAGEAWAYGDRLEAQGLLETPPEFETFSYREALERQGVTSLMRRVYVRRVATGAGNPVLRSIFHLRARGLSTIYRLFPDPEASLLAGILLGVEGGISEDVRTSFNNTSTTHVIAISGFNITLIAGMLITSFGRWFGKRRAIWAAGLGIGLYTVLVGADAAVVRAAIMGGLSLTALRLGRRTDALASLGASAFLMTAVNPLTLWDVGFQLSFAATLGLVLYAEPLQTGFSGWIGRWLPEKTAQRLAGPVGEFGLFTLAAQITTLPLTAFYFNRLSLVSMLANPVILPVQPALMVSGGLATLAGLVWLPLARPPAMIAWLCATFTIRAVEFFGAWPLAVLVLGPLKWPVLLLYYGLLFSITIWVRLPAERRPALPWSGLQVRLPLTTSLMALGVLAVLIWRTWVERPDGRLHVHVLDVGMGEAVLVETPTGRNVLIGGGESGIALSESLGRRLPLASRTLDWLLLVGTAEDQAAGLVGTLDRFPASMVLLAGEGGSYSYRQVLRDLSEAGTPVVPARRGQRLDLGAGVQLQVLVVGPHGAILLLEYGQARILLAPGADPDLMQEPGLWSGAGPMSAVLLPDGGYLAVNPEAWLKGVAPQVALLSVEAGNRRNLPDPEVLAALQGRTVLRTDLHGWIELETDGKLLWVRVERLPPSLDVDAP